MFMRLNNCARKSRKNGFDKRRHGIDALGSISYRVGYAEFKMLNKRAMILRTHC